MEYQIKLCKDCKYFRNAGFYRDASCSREVKTCVVTGEDYNYLDPFRERNSWFGCGKKAKYFVERV